jgi:hypothetical protein
MTWDSIPVKGKRIFIIYKTYRRALGQSKLIITRLFEVLGVTLGGAMPLLSMHSFMA